MSAFLGLLIVIVIPLALISPFAFLLFVVPACGCRCRKGRYGQTLTLEPRCPQHGIPEYRCHSNESASRRRQATRTSRPF